MSRSIVHVGCQACGRGETAARALHQNDVTYHLVSSLEVEMSGSREAAQARMRKLFGFDENLVYVSGGKTHLRLVICRKICLGIILINNQYFCVIQETVEACLLHPDDPFLACGYRGFEMRQHLCSAVVSVSSCKCDPGLGQLVPSSPFGQAYKWANLGKVNIFCVME